MAATKSRELTGRHVLMMLLAFFGVMLAVNAYFTFVAVKSFRGEDVKRSYRQGLEYNQTIRARDLQNDLGWSARVNLIGSTANGHELVVKLENRNGMPVSNLTLSGTLRHPVDMEKDIVLIFEDSGAGRFAANLENIAGQWGLRAEARKDSQTFKFEQDLWVK